MFPNRSAPEDSNRSRGRARAWLRGTPMRLAPAQRTKGVERGRVFTVVNSNVMRRRLDKRVEPRCGRTCAGTCAGYLCGRATCCQHHFRVLRSRRPLRQYVHRYLAFEERG